MMARAGRDFELLVARIEKMLGPVGAKVTSPDYIVDQITGRQREVDASIRLSNGQSEHITTIECRDYSNVKQDDRWIEQLVTKREKLGVAKTIAVSSTGFSDSAMKTAKHYDIELRQMSKITDEEIAQEWLRPVKISLLYPAFVLDSATIVDMEGDPIRRDDLPDCIGRSFDSNPTATPFIKHKNVKALVSPADLFDANIEKCPWVERDDEFPFVIDIESRGDAWSIVTKDGLKIVSKLILKYLVEKREAASKVRAVRRYSSLNKELMDQIQITYDMGDKLVESDFYGRLSKPFPKS